MINYILGVLIVAAVVYSIIKLVKRRKAGGCCAGCSACGQAEEKTCAACRQRSISKS